MSGFFEQAKSKVCLSEGTHATMRPLVSTWEQRKLGELLLFQNGFNGSSESFGSGIPLISVMDVLDDEFITHETIRGKARLNYEEASRYCVEYGDVLFQRSSENQEDAGTSNVYLDQHVPSAFGGFVIRGKKVDEYNPIFIKYLLGSSFIRKQIIHRAQGAQHINVSQDTLADVVLLMPSMREQEAVGLVFLHLANLITLHQRKHDKLVQLKKSMLDKMFPKPGEAEPEIRFAGFTDPWEQRKLGEAATIVGGGTPSTNNDAYWDGDIDWYSPAELGEQVYADRSVRRITQAGYDNCSATLLPADKTILFTSRAGIGNTAILRRSACTNQGFQSLVVDDDTDVYFVYSMTDRIKKFAEQKASGSTFLEISGKGLAAGEFAFPSKDEQTAIGSMFKQLDHLITLHQRKLELLRNTKKSLLERMFV